jgi:dimethylhistidine N-methyltransferase
MRRKLKSDPTGEFEADVRAGLSGKGQKEIPSKYFYDDLGTAIFEAITLLPEYGLTRADVRLLDSHASDMAELAGDLSVVAELGNGSGEKAHCLLPSLIKRRALTYCPIDLSAAALARSRRDLADISKVKVAPMRASYIEGLAAASKLRSANTSMLVLFLGSSIGNFDPPAAVDFLKSVREELKVGDILLLSCDLVKSQDLLLAAYDDATGVTAAFNLNLLARINRELGGNFNLSRFRHEARYNHNEQRIEMHLRSTADQIVSVGESFRVTLKKDETIWTESSYKFRTRQIPPMAESAGFYCDIQWTDSEWPFAQSVLQVR